MKKKNYDFILNIMIVLTTFWAVLMYFIGPPDILGSHDIQCFKYFTTDSNILAAAGSFLYLIYSMKDSKNPGDKIPKWVTILKFVGTVAASITLLTVVCFLAPVAGFRGKGLQTVLLFFKGNVLVLHLTTPVLSIISTLFLERKEKITAKEAAFGMLPTVIYSFVYLFMVVIIQQWDDWYGFTFGGRYALVPIVMLIMFSFSFGLSQIERKIKNIRSQI